MEVLLEVMRQLGQCTSGFKLVKNQCKQDGEEDAEEGKQLMQIAGY